jgi:hypothetical protein
MLKGPIQEEPYRGLEGVVIDGTELFDDRLQEWRDFHNFNRSHGAPGARHHMRG